MKLTSQWMTWVLVACLGAAAPSAWSRPDLTPLRAQFQLPGNEIDYAVAKLTVDQLIDPTTDAAVIHRELDYWERIVRSQVPAGAEARQVLDALLKTIYQPGPWNQGRPFTYDLSDPLGRNPRNKLLATYLDTRKGNCVSMPMLVLILGQRLDLPVALATAPNHVLVKFADDSQQTWVNIEATAGGFKFDSSYERETGISVKAIANELYLRPLAPNEGVGVMASTLMEHYAAKKNGDALLAVAELALAANAKDPVALVWKANAYYILLQERYVKRYPTAREIPPALHDDFRRLSSANLAWIARAEQLGWTETTREQEAIYLQSIQREKAQRGH